MNDKTIESIGSDPEFQQIGSNLLACGTHGARVAAYNDLIACADRYVAAQSDAGTVQRVPGADWELVSAGAGAAHRTVGSHSPVEHEVAEDPLTGELEIMPSSLGDLHAELLQKGDRVSVDAAAQLRAMRRQIFTYEVELDELKSLPAPGADVEQVALEPVSGDLLPAVGSKVLIHLGRQNEWVEYMVAGYYVHRALKHQINEGEKHAHRVFVRVVDTKGNDNARLLADVFPVGTDPDILERAL